jgi:hypothetical protein
MTLREYDVSQVSTRGQVMKLRHILPFALLFAWQIAPQRPDTTPPRTRVSLSLGYGLASLEDYTAPSFDCYGNQTSPELSEAVDVQSRGGRLDVVSGTLRMTGFAGHTTSGRSDVAGTFGGFQLATEDQGAGFGLGLTFGAPHAVSSTPTRLNAYLRIGDAQRPHFRADYLPPSEALGVASLWRAGAEFEASRSGGVSGFIGGGQTPFGSAVGLLDLAVPVTGGLDLLLHGLVGPGHKNSPWGLALGARFTVAR